MTHLRDTTNKGMGGATAGRWRQQPQSRGAGLWRQQPQPRAVAVAQLSHLSQTRPGRALASTRSRGNGRRHLEFGVAARRHARLAEQKQGKPNGAVFERNKDKAP